MPAVAVYVARQGDEVAVATVISAMVNSTFEMPDGFGAGSLAMASNTTPVISAVPLAGSTIDAVGAVVSPVGPSIVAPTATDEEVAMPPDRDTTTNGPPLPDCALNTLLVQAVVQLVPNTPPPAGTSKVMVGCGITGASN